MTCSSSVQEPLACFLESFSSVADDHRADSLGQDEGKLIWRLAVFSVEIRFRYCLPLVKPYFFLPATQLWLALILRRLQSAMYTNLFIWKTQRKLVSHLRHVFFLLFFSRNNRTMNSVRAPVVFNWYRSVFYAFLAKCTIKLFWEQVWSVCISLQATLQLGFSYSPKPSPPNSAQAEAGHWVHLEKETAEQSKRTERENNEQRLFSLFYLNISLLYLVVVFFQAFCLLFS